MDSEYLRYSDYVLDESDPDNLKIDYYAYRSSQELTVPSSLLSGITYQSSGNYLAVYFHNINKVHFYRGCRSFVEDLLHLCDKRFTPDHYWDEYKDELVLESVLDYEEDPESIEKAYESYFCEHYEDPIHFELHSVRIPQKKKKRKK